MLVMSPKARLMLRRERRRQLDAIRGRLGEQRHDSLVDRVCVVIRAEREAGRIVVAFNLEGPLRRAIRGSLCREGWGWEAAEAAAKHIVDAGLRRLGAERPSWNEGQQEWTINAGTLIERTRCVNCGNHLPEGHTKFCGGLCAGAFNQRLARRRDAEDEDVIRGVEWRD